VPSRCTDTANGSGHGHTASLPKTVADHSSVSPAPKESGLLRRGHPRLSARVPLLIRVKSQSGQTEFVAESINISSQGVCFLTNIEIDPSEPIEVIVLMPTEISRKPQTQCFHGRVVHVATRGEQKEIGVQFIYSL